MIGAYGDKWDVISLLHDLRKQYRRGIHTCNPCQSDGCQNTVIGAGFCKSCIATELEKHIGADGVRAYSEIQDQLSGLHEKSALLFEYLSTIGEGGKGKKDADISHPEALRIIKEWSND